MYLSKTKQIKLLLEGFKHDPEDEERNRERELVGAFTLCVRDDSKRYSDVYDTYHITARDLLLYIRHNDQPTGCEDNEHSVGRVVDPLLSELQAEVDHYSHKARMSDHGTIKHMFEIKSNAYADAKFRVRRWHEEINNNLTGQADKDCSVEGVVE
jgi:hypothetical protein